MSFGRDQCQRLFQSRRPVQNGSADRLRFKQGSEDMFPGSCVSDCESLFQIMPRSSNAHAYVNAGFLALIDVENGFTITQKPTVVFGGIREDFVHANGTEEFLIGRSMSDHDMFEEVRSLCNLFKDHKLQSPLNLRPSSSSPRSSSQPRILFSAQSHTGGSSHLAFSTR